MAEQLLHRCLVCDPGHHGHLWAVWAEATTAEVSDVVRRTLGLEPATVRLATNAETRRLVGPLEPDRALWISQHPNDAP